MHKQHRFSSPSVSITSATLRSVLRTIFSLWIYTLKYVLLIFIYFWIFGQKGIILKMFQNLIFVECWFFLNFLFLYVTVCNVLKWFISDFDNESSGSSSRKSFSESRWLTIFGDLTDDGSVRELMSHIFRMDEPELNQRLAGYGLESHQFNLKKYNELVEERKVVLIKNPRTASPADRPVEVDR